MKLVPNPITVAAGLGLLAAVLLPPPARSQPAWPYPPPMAASTTPDAQRNALRNLRSEVSWLQNATRTAVNSPTGMSLVWQQFQQLRRSYIAFRLTLNPRQLAEGANELAELDAGLDILQEAFGYYDRDVGAGRPVSAALRDMCKVLGEGAGLWLQEVVKNSARLRVGG